MKLVVISHKETWRDPASPSGFSTVGGFPFQMRAISELFDKTTIMVPIQDSHLPPGAIFLSGHVVRVVPLAAPNGVKWQRKLNMIGWTIRHFLVLWREVRRADAVHTPVGGDIGTIGIFVALAQGKPLFVRHCGTWGEPISWIDRLLQKLLEIIAGRKNVVLATGGLDSNPSRRNANIRWIFSTSITQKELDHLSIAKPWSPGSPLRLIYVGRLSAPKNVETILRALPLIQAKFAGIHLDIIGEGEHRQVLEALTSELGLNKFVVFHGNLNHESVMKALSLAHIFVFPSLREGFPKAVLEALACGLPVIATNTSVIPNLLKNGCGILLFDPTAESLAGAIFEITSDPIGLVRIGKVAHQVAKGFTLEAWGEEIHEHLQLAWGPLKAGER